MQKATCQLINNASLTKQRNGITGLRSSDSVLFPLEAVVCLAWLVSLHSPNIAASGTGGNVSCCQ